jgi:nitrile hydratase subunit beta
MNGIHDMGGMQDMGPIRPEKDEPVFHAAWEARAFALFVAVDESNRYQIELIPPAEYLRMSYYERWATSLAETLKKAGLATSAEIETGKAIGGKVAGRRVLSVAEVAKMITPGPPTSAATSAAPRFRAGQSVRARDINPVGHTRSPRYVRGRLGTVERMCGVEPLWDIDADGRHVSSKPQPVYSVRFTARELWGEVANHLDSIYVDMWEDYLEPA